MIRVVVDTNVVVSAMLRSGGLPETVFNLAISGGVHFFASEAILAEYEEVLRRPRLGIDPDNVTHAMSRIRAMASIVTPGERVTAAFDPDDNVFLECVQSAQADYLVTGNIKHFPERWSVAQIVTPRQFVDVWTASAD